MMASAPAPKTATEPAAPPAEDKPPRQSKLPVVKMPEGMKETDVGAAYYMGDPSPAEIDKAIAEKHDNPSFLAKAKFLADMGIANSAAVLLALENFTPPAKTHTPAPAT